MVTLTGAILFLSYFFCLLLLIRPLGGYLTRVFAGERVFLSPVLLPVERLLYRLAKFDPSEEEHWLIYARNLLAANLLGFVLLYTMLRLQDVLPLNPEHLPAFAPDTAFNAALSFVSNTNWQSYSGETQATYLSQMMGFAVQNFLSAATGLAVAIAFIRGLCRRSAKTIGNFWVDWTRSVLYFLLPISFIAALLLIALGVPQNFDAYTHVMTVEGQTQIIPQGPVASQEAIKMLGTNGGGFFNANSAHPYENPSALTNFIEMLLMGLSGAALTNVFGRMAGDERQGWAIFTAMFCLFTMTALPLFWLESHLPQVYSLLGVDLSMGNMEGKEVRFGVAASSLFAALTTAISCGAVNAMHDSFSALGGMTPLLNMLLGEVVFGGIGAGFYGMMLFVILAIFMSGLMIGRTPEYLGKKIEVKEMQLTVLGILITPSAILALSALAIALPAGRLGILNPGPHGFSELFYAYTSAAANNGSAFAGLSANTPFYNITLGLGMFLGRFLMIVPVLALTGQLVQKNRAEPSSGSLSTQGLLFVLFLLGVVIVVAGLTFFPALSLGPLAEYFSA